MNNSIWAPYLVHWNEQHTVYYVSLCWLKERYEDNKMGCLQIGTFNWRMVKRWVNKHNVGFKIISAVSQGTVLNLLMRKQAAPWNRNILLLITRT